MKEKTMSRENDRSSIIEGIRGRLTGRAAGGLFVRVQEKQKNVLRLLGPCMELGVHNFNAKDGKWNKVICSKKLLVGKTPTVSRNKNCIVCSHVADLIRRGKTKTAEKLKVQTIFSWNAIFKNDPNDENDELIAKIFEHRWQVFEGIGDILEDTDDFQDPVSGIGIIVRKRVKGVGEYKQTSYSVVAGEEWPLSKTEKRLELKDLNDFYRFPKDTAPIADALGIEREEFAEEEDEEEEDTEEEKEDDDEEDEEEEKPSKKAKKSKKSKDGVDDEDLEDDEEEEDEDEDEDEEE